MALVPNRLIRKLAGVLPVPERIKAVFPAVLGIAAFLLSFFLAHSSRGAEPVRFNLEGVRSGSFLLAGIYDQAVSGNMLLYDTLASLSLNLGISPLIFLLAACSGVYLLVFSTACLLGGYRAGLVSLAAAGLLGTSAGWGWDIEQAFYSFFVMLALALLILRRRENTLKNNLLAGLAIGFSMLARTPLFLFPLLVTACDWIFAVERRRGLVLRSLLFLAASYALLVPGALIRQQVSGKFSFFDDRRAACNIVTAARGSVYTMEGDCRKLAGLGKEDSATVYFLREVGKDPVSYALGVLRRLRAIFLFNPLVFGLFLAALAAVRGREARLNFLLPGYFILIHSLLSVEGRYFQPLAYVIAPLAIAALFPRRLEGDTTPCAFSIQAPRALFWLSSCAVLAVEVLVLAYPVRTGNIFSREALRLAAGRFPGDRVIGEMQCNESLKDGEYSAYYACLDGYSRKFGDEVYGYFLQARVSPKPSGLALPRELEMRCLVIRMLREFELGDLGAARSSSGLAYAKYEAEVNGLRGTPYKTDRELQRHIRQDENNFWDRYVYNPLLMWPPEGIAKILSGLEKSRTLTARLGLLKYVAANACRSGGTAFCLSKRDDIFSALAGDLLRRRRAGLALLPGKAGDGYAAAAAYFRALSAASTAAPNRALFGEGVYEEELPILLELRGIKEPGLALDKVEGCLRLQKRSFYYALRALLSLESGRKGSFRESLDALESGLAGDPDLLRFLSGRESAAGNKARARYLEALAEKVLPTVNQADDTKAGRSKRLSDEAVEKIRAGDMTSAERLLHSALDIDERNSEAFMDLCYIRRIEKKKEKALEACRSAADTVHSNPARNTHGFRLMASEASFESYKLLIELGRKEEALETLRGCIERAPSSWPRLDAARKEFADSGGKTAE